MNDRPDIDAVVETLILSAKRFAETGDHGELRHIRSLAALADGPLLINFADVVAIALREQHVQVTDLREMWLMGLQLGVRAMQVPKRVNKKVVVDRSIIIGSSVGIEQRMSRCRTIVNDVADQQKREAMMALGDAVAAVLPSLPESGRERMVDDLSELLSHAQCAKPRAEWLKVSSTGLVDAAKAVGALAEPIVVATKCLLALFNVHL